MTVEPEAPGFRSDAELAVWQVLKSELGEGDALITNLRLTDANGDHEGDLIVGLPGAGIAVIEVKGGRVAHNGTDWVQHGGRSKRIDPVDQARRAKYALRSYLDSRDTWDRRRVRMTHLVAFPYSAVPRDLSLPECPRWMVLDKHDLAANPLDLVRNALTTQENSTPVAEAPDIDALLRTVRPDIAVPPDALITEREVEIARTRSRRRRWTAAGVASVLLAGTGVGAGVYVARSSGTQSDAGLDPRFSTCLEARVAGYGRYVEGRDAEYSWYRDLDKDGITCE